jgi:hypothetical protein
MSIVQVGRDVIDAARELDFNTIEREVTQPIRVLVAGRDDMSNRELTRTAFGSPELLQAIGTLELLELAEDAHPIIPPGLDVALLVVPAAQEPDSTDLTLLAALRAYAVPTIIVRLQPNTGSGSSSPLASQWQLDIPPKRQVTASLASTGELLHRLGDALATLDRHKLAPLAFRFAPLRARLVEDIVRDSSKVNGEFALFSSLPSLIPVVGGIVSSVADLFMLTKNQVTLTFRIAGIYGRDLSNRTAVLLEIAPVIGGAFLWRSAARTLVALLPGALSAVPKTFVAYVGTYVVGQMAHYYYREGRRPSPEVIESMRRDGLNLVRKIFTHE